MAYVSVASGPNVGIAYERETTPGDLNATPDMKALRTIGKNINEQRDRLRSREVREDRMRPRGRHGFRQATGSLPGEFQMLNWDDWLAAGMASEWVADGTDFVLNIGKTLITHTVERRFTDIAAYQLFRGVLVNQMSWNIRPEQIVEFNLDLLGIPQGAMTATPRDTTVTAAPTRQAFTAFEGWIRYTPPAGTATDIAVVTGLTLSVNNARRLLRVIGLQHGAGVAEGSAVVEGEATIMLFDRAFYNLFANETEVRLTTRMRELNNPANFIELEMPAVTFFSADLDPPPEGEMPMRMGFEANVGAAGNSGGGSTNTSLRIRRSVPV